MIDVLNRVVCFKYLQSVFSSYGTQTTASPSGRGRLGSFHEQMLRSSGPVDVGEAVARQHPHSVSTVPAAA